jgi:hypothetical protein
MSDSVATLLRRCEGIAAGFEAVVARRRPEPAWLGESGRVALAGLGLAEGPARVAEYLWRSMGIDARVIPASSFLNETPIARDGESLVVFSQRLSPNARLLMGRLKEFTTGRLVTTLDDASCPVLGQWRDDGGAVYVLPPDQPEDGLLIRVQGPVWSTLGVFCLTQDLADHRGHRLPWRLDAAELTLRYQNAFTCGLEMGLNYGPRLRAQPITMVTAGEIIGLAHGLRWKWLEAFWSAVVPVVDVLAFVHGPFQGVFGKSSTVVFLRTETTTHVELGSRLRTVLPPEHLVFELVSTLPSALAVFEHDATLNGMICGALKGTDPELEQWPGQDADGAIYGIDRRFR